MLTYSGCVCTGSARTSTGGSGCSAPPGPFRDSAECGATPAVPRSDQQVAAARRWGGHTLAYLPLRVFAVRTAGPPGRTAHAPAERKWCLLQPRRQSCLPPGARRRWGRSEVPSWSRAERTRKGQRNGARRSRWHRGVLLTVLGGAPMSALGTRERVWGERSPPPARHGPGSGSPLCTARGPETFMRTSDRHRGRPTSPPAAAHRLCPAAPRHDPGHLGALQGQGAADPGGGTG